MCKNTTSSTINHVSTLLPQWTALPWMGQLRQNRSWTRQYLWGLHKGFSEGNALRGTVQTLTEVVDWKKSSWHAIKDCAYNRTRLEWHLGDNANLEPRKVLCGLVRQQARFLIRVNRLVVALAKSQDHRASCGVFAFGLPNAVRRWLGMRYPVTRASQSGGRGRILRARWLK